MKDLIKNYIEDCSTPDEFCFSVSCSECGYTWKSIPVRFSRAQVMPQTE